MNYTDLQEAGRKMKLEELEENIRQLAGDARFAAVIAFMERNHDSYTVAVSSQAMAGDHGKLAHCSGSLHAVKTLQAQLANIITPPPKRSLPKPPAD